jgi:hypothetical protein
MPSGFSRNLGGPAAFGAGQAGHIQPRPLNATLMPTVILLIRLRKIDFLRGRGRVFTLQLSPGGNRIADRVVGFGSAETTSGP